MAGGCWAHGICNTREALIHPGCSIEQVYLCREPIDFRKSINGLSVLVEQELGLNPFGNALYVFINRQHTKIKVLYWHRNGFCLWLKRLEAEKFAWLRRVMRELPAARTVEEIEALLPWNLHAVDLTIEMVR